MNRYRVLFNCLDRAMGKLPLTWDGEAISPKQAVEKIEIDSKRNGWSDIEIIRIYERKQINEIGVVA